MSDEQLSASKLVFINVDDRENLSFYFNVDEQSTVETSKIHTSPDCTIEINEECYLRLFKGESTFENEVELGNLKILGDSKLLREFGKHLRQSS